LFTPLIIAFCLTALSGVSAAQLTSMNRMGAVAGFSAAAGILAALGIFIGWQLAGITGAAYGFLASRIAVIAQDLYTIRLLGAEGWLSAANWRRIVRQLAVGAAFATVYLFVPKRSPWLLIPAFVHGGGVVSWMLRHQLRRFLASAPAPAS
ncbi:MAG TPA: hypothetical protein PKH32_00110, partial [Verrucomicrobiota bacterium]|nr:hypothetical protein [Verrucomicrobiota bacterium]